MSKYEQPKCDCGTSLIFVAEEGREVCYYIKKDGTKGRQIDVRSSALCGADWLECPKCKNCYDTDMRLMPTNVDKFLRGEIR
jgi:hypothetical protein